jgi:hypothetical protein
MSIKLVLTDTGTAVPMEYHVIESAAAQYGNNQTYVVVRSFYSQDAYESSKRALAETPVMLLGTPPRNADLIDWVQAQLIAPVDTSLSLNAYLNRWQFTGGEIVDHAPQPDPVVATPTPTPTPTPAPSDDSGSTGDAGSADDAGTQTGSDAGSATQTTADDSGAAASDSDASSGTAAVDPNSAAPEETPAATSADDDQSGSTADSNVTDEPAKS